MNCVALITWTVPLLLQSRWWWSSSMSRMETCWVTWGRAADWTTPTTRTRMWSPRPAWRHSSWRGSRGRWLMGWHFWAQTRWADPNAQAENVLSNLTSESKWRPISSVLMHILSSVPDRPSWSRSQKRSGWWGGALQGDGLRYGQGHSAGGHLSENLQGDQRLCVSSVP